MNDMRHTELILQNKISNETIHFGWMHCTFDVSVLQTCNFLLIGIFRPVSEDEF